MRWIVGAMMFARFHGSNHFTHILDPKSILESSCENVAGQLRQKLLATAGTNVTKPCTSGKETEPRNIPLTDYRCQGWQKLDMYWGPLYGSHVVW